MQYPLKTDCVTTPCLEASPMKPKIRLDLSALSVTSFTLDGRLDGAASTTFTDTEDASCFRYCTSDDQHTGTLVPATGC